MAFFKWIKFTFNTPCASRHRNRKVDLGKNSHSGMEAAGSLHKRNSLHNPPSLNHRRSSSLFSSPLNPLSPRYSSYFSSRKNW